MRLLRLLLVAISFVALTLVAFSQELPPPQDFSLIVLPDIQNETQYYPQVLDTETQWIANQRTALNIQGVLGLGDITNNGSDQSQWSTADSAFHTLDVAEIPYFLAVGNHDYDNLIPQNRVASGFNQWFGPERYEHFPWYLGNYNGGNENFYGMLNINGRNFLVLALEFVPRDEALNWADGILAQYPYTEAIVITHSFLYVDGTRVDQCDTSDMNYNNYGDLVWSKLISQHPNVDLVLNGHLTSGHAAHRGDLGIYGNLVNQMFSNYQTMTNGGNGYLRILTFHYGTDTIDVKTYSPYLNAYMTDSANQFTVPWHAPLITSTTGIISGRVRDVGTCKAIPNAQITAYGNTVTTDATGHYSVTLPAGYFAVSATATNYSNGSQNVVVNNGYSADTNFFLTYSPPPPCPLNPAEPSVTICGIANGAIVSSPLAVLAGANDSSAVSYMQLYVDSVKIVQQSGPTLNYSEPLGPGTHKLTVQAHDVASVTYKQTINVTVPSPAPCTLNTASPSVTICSPANGANVSSPFTITAGTTDSNPVSNIQLWVDGKKLTQQLGGTLNATAALADGIHRLTVQAVDSMGASIKQNISITVGVWSADPPPCTLNPASPSVTICTPTDGSTVTSPVPVTAGTTDTNSVTSIQLFIDGKGSTIQNGGTFNGSATLPSGAHRLTIQAKDSTGTVLKQTVNVTVP